MASMTRESREATPSPKTPPSSTRLSSSSPTKITRVQEKQELQHLNDRLANYIERVIRLEETNSKLSQELIISKETVERDVSSLKLMYENELSEARKVLDETAREKARLQIECSKNAEERDGLKAKLNSETNAKEKLQEEVDDLLRKLSERDGQLAKVNNEARKLSNQVEELAAECKEIKEALQTAKYTLEQETLTRVDLENQKQSLNEDLHFKKQIYNQELLEIKAQLRHVETRSITMETEFKTKYEGALQEKLAELREEYEEKTKQQKMDTESMFTSKYNELKEQSERDAQVISSLRENNRKITSQSASFKSDHNVMVNKIAALENRIKELEDAKAKDETDSANEMAELNAEIRMLRKKLDDSAIEYEDLLGVKTALLMELSAYRKMLEGEEERLDITPPDSPVYGPSPFSKRRSAKRARVEETSVIRTPTAIGSVQIQEADKDGKFVKLYNASDTDEALGGWSISRQVVGGETKSYKFTPRYTLRANSSVVIWASEAGGQHKPPGELICKQVSSWGTGEKVVTLLMDNNGEEKASFVEEIQKLSYDSTDSRPMYQTRSDVRPGDRCTIC